MADDATTVGTVQLDVEFSDKSIAIEMNKLQKTFNGMDLTSGFKGTLSSFSKGINSFAKKSINSMTNSFRAMGQAGEGASNKAAQSTGTMNAQYDKTQEKIRGIQAELIKVDTQLGTIRDRYADFPAMSGLTKGETMDQLLGADREYQKLTAEAAKLEAKLEPLTAKNKELSKVIRQSGNEAQETGKRMENMGNVAQGTGSKLRKMGSIVKKVTMSMFGLNRIKRIFSHETDRASNATSNFNNTLNRVSRTIARNLIVYGLIIKGLRGMMSYMWSALKTNEQFAHSLNVIRTNLLVAFQPIYDFVLPALNALMQGIATVTTYIASAISALFGKTYKQSFGAAKSMNKQIEAMNGLGKATKGTGKAAKKAGKEAKGALMPFDEINQLNLDKGADAGSPDIGGGGGAGGFEMAMPDMTTIDMSGINKFKEIMSKIFEPFKLAWENEGQATVNAIKYTLTGIGGLVKAIGKSWLDVWTNGTGQAILETILRILQNIFKLVGDIANSFTLAWTNAGTGTAIMQAIHDIIQSILDVLERLGKSLNNVWGEVGNVVAQTFLDILRSTLETLAHLGEKLVWVWDHGGQHLFEGFLKLGAKIFELAGYIYTEFVAPFVNWFIDLMVPAIAKVMDWVGKLFVAFANLIDWLLGDGKPVLDTIVIVLGSMAAAFGIVKGAILAKTAVVTAYTAVMGLAKGAAVAFKSAIAAITSPIGLVTLAIGTVIAITTALYRNWDTVGLWLKETWQSIKDKAEEIWNGIAEFFEELWASITEVLTVAWNTIVEFLVELWEGLSESVTEIWTTISEFISETWNSIKTKTSEIWNAIKTFLIETIWNPIKTAAQTIWNGIKKVILDPINQAWTKLKEIWTNIKTFILGKWNEIRQGIANMKDKLVNAIMKPFKIADEKIHGIIGDAKNWGRNLIQNFIDGIKAMIGKVKDAVSNVADTVADFLGFHSPAKKGPGAEADKWMPNLMGMLADGIQDNIYEVSAAVSMTAGSIERGIQPNTDDMASAVGSAVLQSMQMAGNNQGQESGDIILQIDGITVGRILGPIIDREKERIGEPVVKSI